MDFDKQELDEMYEEVLHNIEEASSYDNIGKFSFEMQYQTKGADGVWSDCDFNTYKNFENKWHKRGTVVLKVASTEFGAPKDYVRYLRFDETSYKPEGADRSYESNFKAFLVPSLQKVLGNKFTKAFSALIDLSGKYVNFRDVKANPSFRDHVKDGETWTAQYKTPTLAGVFASREDAYAQVLATKSNQSQSEPAKTQTATYPEDVVSAVKMLSGLKQDAATIAKSIGNLTEADVKSILGA